STTHFFSSPLSVTKWGSFLSCCSKIVYSFIYFLSNYSIVKFTFYCRFVCPCVGKKWLFWFFERWLGSSLRIFCWLCAFAKMRNVLACISLKYSYEIKNRMNYFFR